ncbi:MAG TPA: DUF2185 domain-containing protein [Candidatus Dormibacteraeota bacterium]|nr:DUF2185 domain-containing protein [Candidatus Dormibacteraeota bacterium]
MRRGITEDWSIDLDGDYERDIVEGQLRFRAPGRTIWLNVWSKPGVDVSETLAWIRAEARTAHPKDAEEFEELEADEARYASWYSEPGTRALQHSLYGYTIRPGTYVQSVLISDPPGDRDWALNTWRSLRYIRDEPKATTPTSERNSGDIKPLKLGLGACLATKRITVDHLPVRWMYREEPDHADDSGWRFFSGIGEDDDYLSNPDNAGVHDVNTIANFDPSIVPFLDAPVGAAFEREEDKWVKVTDWSPLN